MRNELKTACVQLSVGPDIDRNRQETSELIRKAANQGAQFIITPENTDFIETDKKRKQALVNVSEDNPLIPYYAALAKELGVWLCIGSVKIGLKKPDKLANRSHLFSPEGEIKAIYDKIHLFDVDLPDGEVQRESSEFEPGLEAKIISLCENFTLGMSICYDIRFSHFYRDMAKNGANIFTVPSAFTVPTGKAHWEVMLRARAIECGAYVLAPAQGGIHVGSDKQIRKTYGHSMIIDPWGEIIARRDDDTPGVIVTNLDFKKISLARNAIQQLRHDREYDISKA